MNNNKMSLSKAVIIIFSVSFIIRIIFSLVFGNFSSPQMFEPGMIARNLNHGYGFSMHWPYESNSIERAELVKHPPPYKTAFMPPLTPYLIYLIFNIFGDGKLSYLILMLINSFFGAFTPVFAYLIARQIASEKAAFYTAIASVLFLPAVFSVITFSGSSQYQTFALMILFFSIKSIRTNKLRYFFLTGLFGGIQTLVRSEFLILSLILFVFISFYHLKSTPFPLNLRKFLYILIPFLIIVSPWVYRNYKLFDKLVPVVSHPWHEVWRGNNSDATGGCNGKKGKKIWLGKDYQPHVINRMDSLKYNQNFEIAVDSIMKEETVSYISKNPFHYIVLSLKRAMFLWTIDIYTPRAREIKYSFFIVITFIPFIIGISILTRNNLKDKKYHSAIPFLIFFIYYTLLFGLVNLETRYQVYMFSVALPITGIGWEYIINKTFYRKRAINSKFITVND